MELTIIVEKWYLYLKKQIFWQYTNIDDKYPSLSGRLKNEIEKP